MRHSIDGNLRHDFVVTNWVSGLFIHLFIYFQEGKMIFLDHGIRQV